jgi:hypothetical protein
MTTLSRETAITFDTDTTGEAAPMFIDGPCAMLI